MATPSKFQPIRVYQDDRGRIGVGQVVVPSPGADPTHMVSWDRGGYGQFYSPAAMERLKVREVAQMPLAEFLEATLGATGAAAILATLTTPISIEQHSVPGGRGAMTVRIPKKDVASMPPEEAAEEIKQRLILAGVDLSSVTVSDEADELVYTGTKARGSVIEDVPGTTITREVTEPHRVAE